MTAENCLKLAEYHRGMGDEAAAIMYEERAKHKEAKYTKEYLLTEAQRLKDEGKGAQAQMYLEKAIGKQEKPKPKEKKEEKKETKSKGAK